MNTGTNPNPDRRPLIYLNPKRICVWNTDWYGKLKSASTVSVFHIGTYVPDIRQAGYLAIFFYIRYTAGYRMCFAGYPAWDPVSDWAQYPAGYLAGYLTWLTPSMCSKSRQQSAHAPWITYLGYLWVDVHQTRLIFWARIDARVARTVLRNGTTIIVQSAVRGTVSNLYCL